MMRRLPHPHPSREVPGENDRDRAKRIMVENDRMPALTYWTAQRDLAEAGVRS